MPDRVQPQLGMDTPTVLFDFPAALGSLARSKPGLPSRVERWELFIAGLEIANAYSELISYDEQKSRFETAAQLRREQQRDIYPLDEQYMALLRKGRLPESGGIALGIDRLLMVLTNASELGEVVPFTPETN